MLFHFIIIIIIFFFFLKGRTTNIGTFLSAIGSIQDHFNLSTYDKAIKEKVFKKDLPDSKYKLSKRYVFSFNLLNSVNRYFSEY